MTKQKKEQTPGASTPGQYAIPNHVKELQDLIEYRNMNFAQGNIIKAIYRAGYCDHSDELRDAVKTMWFARREVIRLYMKNGMTMEEAITKINNIDF